MLSRTAAGLSDLAGTLVRLFPRDISLTAAGVLLSLERVGPSRLSDLVAVAGVAQPSMTELVGRLAAAGLVRRSRHPGDGRVVLVSLTADGVALMARRRDAASSRIAALLTGLDPGEVDSLVKALPVMAKLQEIGASALDGQADEDASRAG